MRLRLDIAFERVRGDTQLRAQAAIAADCSTWPAGPTEGASMTDRRDCDLCVSGSALIENEWAYVQWEKNSLSRGHVVIVPRRHVADFFEMTHLEQMAVVELLNEARQFLQSRHSPDGYNIGVNVGSAAGQSRMHVHIHLIPRYAGDVPNPAGGIRCVLPGKLAV